MFRHLPFLQYLSAVHPLLLDFTISVITLSSFMGALQLIPGPWFCYVLVLLISKT